MCAAECRKRKKLKVYYAGGVEKKKVGICDPTHYLLKLCVLSAHKIHIKTITVNYSFYMNAG